MQNSLENNTVEVDESEDRPASKLLESKSSHELSDDKADDGQDAKVAEAEEITEWDAGGL